MQLYKSFLNFLVFTCFLSLIPFGVSAQYDTTSASKEDTRIVNFIEFSVDALNPVYDFGDQLDKNLVGFSINYLRQRKKTRLDYFGVSLSYAHIGSLTASFIDFEDRTSTEMLNMKFLYRYFPSFYFWRIEPFIELGFGPQLIYTLTTTTSFLDDASSLNFENSDFGLAYHAGIGMTAYLVGQVFLHVKFNLNGATSMTYYVPQEYIAGLPIENFNPETSSINYLAWQFGLTVSF